MHAMSKMIGFVATVLLLLAGSQAVQADDTEIFLSQYLLGANASSKPKVLIIFDNSGSMDTIVLGEPAPYDPTVTYPDFGDIQAGRIYWSDNSGPPEDDSDQWFTATRNRCAESFTPLENIGYYQDNVMRWKTDKNPSKSKWDKLNNK